MKVSFSEFGSTLPTFMDKCSAKDQQEQEQIDHPTEEKIDQLWESLAIEYERASDREMIQRYQNFKQRYPDYQPTRQPHWKWYHKKFSVYFSSGTVVENVLERMADRLWNRLAIGYTDASKEEKQRRCQEYKQSYPDVLPPDAWHSLDFANFYFDYCYGETEKSSQAFIEFCKLRRVDNQIGINLFSLIDFKAIFQALNQDNFNWQRNFWSLWIVWELSGKKQIPINQAQEEELIIWIQAEMKNQQGADAASFIRLEAILADIFESDLLRR